MPAPTKYPDWATDGTNTVEPPAGKVAAGWLPAEQPPAGWFNWWQSLVGLWVRWLEEASNASLRKLAALNYTLHMPANGYAGVFRGAAFGLMTGNLDRSWVFVGAGGTIQYSLTDCRSLLVATGTAGASAGEFLAVAYSSSAFGIFVAVGRNGTGNGASAMIYRSTNGTSWAAVTQGGTPDPAGGDWLNGVAFGNGVFVAVGPLGHIQTSPDGVTWTKRMPPVAADTLRAIVYSGSAFVAVGIESETNRGVALRSTDNGATWSRQLFPTAVIYGMTSVAASDKQVLATGAGSSSSSLYVSSDHGVSWASDTTLTGFASVNCATCIRGFFVLGAASGSPPADFGAPPVAIFAGVPGQPWTRVPAPGLATPYGIGSNGDAVVVVGFPGLVAHSLHLVS